jgi:cell division protein FtsB
MNMSDPNVTTSLISALGVIVVGFIGVWTARLARKSAQATATVEERAKIVEGYDKLNEDLEKRNEVLSANVAKLEKRIDECEEKITADRRRITELEYERDSNRRQYMLLRTYAQGLINLLRNANLYVPEAPSEISLHLDD